ncbi:hypothetical protein TNCV_1549481 [Trichonephila clavipes]|nr:hypothetical protein TNCV_1549481 [Trichonephila clavipes]
MFLPGEEMSRVRSRNVYQHVFDFDKGTIITYRNYSLMHHRISARIGRDPMTVKEYGIYQSKTINSGSVCIIKIFASLFGGFVMNAHWQRVFVIVIRSHPRHDEVIGYYTRIYNHQRRLRILVERFRKDSSRHKRLVYGCRVTCLSPYAWHYR